MTAHDQRESKVREHEREADSAEDRAHAYRQAAEILEAAQPNPARYKPDFLRIANGVRRAAHQSDRMASAARQRAHTLKSHMMAGDQARGWDVVTDGLAEHADD